MTVLFTDVAHSTELRSRYGDARADALLRLHETVVRRALAERHGREVQFLGDGFLVTFPKPELAVDCAIEVQRAVDHHNRGDRAQQIHVRIGLHRGPVVERGGNLFGQTVHGAARVTAEAAGDQILVSSEVREALVSIGADVDLVDRGLYWLRGFHDRWRLYEVRWRPSAISLLSPARTPFVEREEERAELRRGVDDARTGRGRLVLVAGEAGVGKSRLVLEVAEEAEAHGLRVLIGHCVQQEGSVPYLPFVEILEEALIGPRSPLALREALGDAGPELARMVPALRGVIPGLPQPVELPPEQAERYLWNSLLGWIDRASRDDPLLLVLEDLHWADTSTLRLLEHLAVHLPHLPLLLVGTYRDVEVAIEHPLARIAGMLARRRLVTRVQLAPLSNAGVARMLQGLGGREPPAALVDAINAEAEGNPFFVEEMFLHLVESGRLLDDEGGFRPDLQVEELGVPDTVRITVTERLARLSPTTRSTLSAAAVIGRVFASELLERITEEPEGIVDALDEAERARLVAPAKGAGRLQFSHELIRQTLLADTSTVRRELLHDKVATALEDAYADDLDAHAEDIAFHLLRAGRVDRDRLVPHLMTAGDRALDAAAASTAVAHFEQALDLLGDGDPARRACLWERLATARRGAREWEGALAAWTTALALYGELDRREDVGRVCWVMVYLLTWSGRYEDAMRVSAQGLTALGGLANPDRARLLAATGWVVSLAGDHDAATRLFTQARVLVDGLDDRRATADVLHLETFHHMGFAELTQGIEVGSRAVEVYEEEGAVWDLCSVLGFVMFLTGTRSRREGTDALAERVAALAQRIGHLGAAFLEAVDRSRRAIMRVDPATVRALGATQVELCEQGSLPWLYVGYLYLGLAARLRGDDADAERQLRRATELEPASAFAGQSAAQLAVHLAYMGRAEEVLALYAERADGLPRPGVVNSLGAWNALLGFTEALFVAGHREEAAAGYELITTALAQTGDWVTFDVRFTSTRAGIAAAAGRRWDDAERHFGTALETAGVIGHRLERADVHRLLAWTYRDRGGPGDDARAQDLWDRAAAAYRELGLREPALPTPIGRPRT